MIRACRPLPDRMYPDRAAARDERWVEWVFIQQRSGPGFAIDGAEFAP